MLLAKVSAPARFALRGSSRLKRPLLVLRAQGKATSSIDEAVEAKWGEGAVAPTGTARNTELGIFVNSHFDSGNIEVVSVADPSNIILNIHPDPYCKTDDASHFHWFNYRMTGVRDVPLTMHMTNAGQASFPKAWEGYQACASYDFDHWFRVPTSYDSEKGVLTIRHTPTCDAVRYAYFAPYTWWRHSKLIARMQAKPQVNLLMIGETIDGHDLDLLQLGTHGPGKPLVWIIARQHPGETQAEWFMEGLLERLTDPHDAVARTLIRDAVLYIMPNCNPDGTWRGHLRTNAAGVNLNRAWAEPCAEDSPEVYHLLRVMKEKGVDMCIDVHGDEELPYCFIAGAEGTPSWDQRKQQLQDTFCDAFKRSSPDFQTKIGYELDAPGEANMSICTNQLSERFNCFAATLEMPFKDTADHPDNVQGWSPERSKKFGAAMLPAVLEMLPLLREN